jgi:hypothetical protein
MENFIEIAELNIQRLRDEDEHLAATLRGIETRRAELQREIEAGSSAVAYYRQVMGTADVNGTSAPTVTVTALGPRNRPRKAGAPTQADRLEDFMVANGGEAAVSELADHLVATGVYAEDQRQSLYRRVYATLLRDRRFRRVSAGKFGLARPDKPQSFLTKAAAESWDNDAIKVVQAFMSEPEKL